MPRPIAVLDDVRVASPCTVPWEGMRGDDRVRHCGECRLNVYNLSAMSRREAEALVRGKEGRLCVRFFRRADGTMITRDCPAGIRALRRKAARLAAAVAALFLGAFAAGCRRGPDGSEGPPVPPDGVGRGTTGVVAEPPEMQGRIAHPIQGDVADPPALQGEVFVPEEPKR
jgi:hypothetical protein